MRMLPRAGALCGAVLLTFATGAAAHDPALSASSRIRTSDPEIADLLEEGIARSSTLRTLASQLEATHWFVFVERGHCPGRRVTGCLVHVVTQYAGDPTLRIYIDVGRLPARDSRIMTIAHELQHAREVTLAPGVIDSSTLRTFFEHAGTRTSISTWSTVYETDAAQQIGSRVSGELRRNRVAGSAGRSKSAVPRVAR